MGLIVLLTDFGLQDSYVGVMKGVIAGLSSDSRVIDLTHNLSPQDIRAARFSLTSSCDYFPADTVYGIVVDPGVGTERATVAAQIQTRAGLQTVVAPDNGILTGFAITQAVALTDSRYWRTSVPSRTFHGRDIFAPVAAHLANGVALGKLGRSILPEQLTQLGMDRPVITAAGCGGIVQYIDRFGNLVTNISGDSLAAAAWEVFICDRTVSFYATYGLAQPGQLLALIGSHGYVEVAASGASAAAVLAAAVGTAVEVRYLEQRGK